MVSLIQRVLQERFNCSISHVCYIHTMYMQVCTYMEPHTLMDTTLMASGDPYLQLLGDRASIGTSFQVNVSSSATV